MSTLHEAEESYRRIAAHAWRAPTDAVLADRVG